MFNPSKSRGLMHGIPWERDHEIAYTLEIAFEELYDSANHYVKEVTDLDIYLGAVLRGYEGRRFTDY